MNNFIIRPLPYNSFSALFDLDAAELYKLGAVKIVADKKPGFPCRVSLEDAEIGEELILLNYQHHATPSPYRAWGAIFVRRHAPATALRMNEVPPLLHHRLLSVRAYTTTGMMKVATVTEGAGLAKILLQFFTDPAIGYVHIHNAKEGCYHCMAVRAADLP